MSKFKVGDRVRVIDPSGSPRYYKLGDICTVTDIDDYIVYTGPGMGMLPERFELAPETPKTPSKFHVFFHNKHPFDTLEEAEEFAKSKVNDNLGSPVGIFQCVKAFHSVTEIKEVTLA